MLSLTKISCWAEIHHPIWLDIIRVALGSYLFMKGLYFLQHQEILGTMLPESVQIAAIVVIVHYITFAHLVGGVCIAIGLFTRLSVLFQLPILLGAVFIKNMSMNAFGAEWFIAFTVLLGLGVMLLMGSGTYSADYYLDKHKDR